MPDILDNTVSCLFADCFEYQVRVSSPTVAYSYNYNK